MQNLIKLLCVLLIMTSCASSYHPIKPATLPYGNASQSGSITYAAQPNILEQSRNKKYANKELKRPVKLVALEFTNNTNRTINFRQDVRIFLGSQSVLPVEPAVIHQSLKQPSALYLLWGLLWLNISKCENNDCSVTPLPLGLVIGLINVSVASSANKNFLKELNEQNLLDKSIAPGQTVTGLIGISSDTHGPITLRINE